VRLFWDGGSRAQFYVLHQGLTNFGTALTKRLLAFPTALSPQQLFHGPQLTAVFFLSTAQPQTSVSRKQSKLTEDTARCSDQTPVQRADTVWRPCRPRSVRRELDTCAARLRRARQRPPCQPNMAARLHCSLQGQSSAVRARGVWEVFGFNTYPIEYLDTCIEC
jgi:hypothetical protein